MNQAATIQLKGTVSTRKRGTAGKLFISLLVLFAIVFAGYSYWPDIKPYLNHFGHSLVTVIASRIAPAAAKPASAGDSLTAVLSPSAKAETIQPKMLPAPGLAKRVIQTAAVSSSFNELPVLTAGQKRLKVA